MTTDIHAAFEAKYEASAQDPACAEDLRVFTDGWQARDAEIAALRAEVERLKAGLQWYADGEHHNLDWEVPDEPGWMCVSPDDPVDETWMVEDGGVARTVLAGGHMVNDGDIIAEPLMSEEAYRGMLGRVRELVALDPAPESQEGRALAIMSAQLERYEARMHPIDAARSAAQGGIDGR